MSWLYTFALCCFGSVLLAVVAVLALIVLNLDCLCRIVGQWLRIEAKNVELAGTLKGKETIGFFHPYAHAGGGGERVLWCAIRAIQEHHAGVHAVVYTGDKGVTKSEFLELALNRFGVELEAETVHFVYLRNRRWVDAASWPRFTLAGQSLGSVVLAVEAICSFRPDVLIDSMGYAFTLPLFKYVCGSRVAAYVHYPTISTDMLAQVKARDVSVCNDAAIAKSATLSRAKATYYHVFAKAYGMVGNTAEVVMVNSSWTNGHIEKLWDMKGKTAIVYPPCDTEGLTELPLARAGLEAGGALVLSLAQFRPEKNHALQLRSLARLFTLSPRCRCSGPQRVRLVLAGGCRDEQDAARVADLRTLAAELALRQCPDDDLQARDEDWDVAFRTNISNDEMRKLMGQATIGLHTMSQEHFGISVVEFMAAGACVLAHSSGGPLMDIVTPYEGQQTGYLAKDVEEYAKAMKDILDMSVDDRQQMARAAREAVRVRFSQEAFERAIADRMIAPLRQGKT